MSRLPFFDELFETSTEAIVLLDEEGRALKTNTAFGDLFGYSSQEVTGTAIDELLAPSNAREEALAATRRAVTGHKEVEHSTTICDRCLKTRYPEVEED